MKRLTGIVLLSVFCFFCSCRQAQLEEPNANSENVGQNLQEVELSLIMPGGKTKTSLGLKDGDSYPVYWEEGDVITLNGKRSAAVSAADAGSASARISVKTDAVSPFNILYPGVDGVADQVTFPSTQVYREGSFDANALPMYATTSSLKDEVSLNYLASVLRIPMRFTSATTLSRISVSAKGGEPVHGTYTIGKTNGALNGELTATQGNSTLLYTFGENGTQLAAGETVFHIAVPYGTYAEGFEFRCYDKDGHFMVAYWDQTEVAAGKVYEFAQQTFIPSEKAFLIATPDDLLTLASKYNGGEYAFFEAQVVNDIDMTGKGYTNEGFSFHGTLNGFGHEIKGLTTPLFNLLYGSVKDLVLTADVVVSEVSDWDVINQYGAGLIANYVYSGYDGQIIENVTVNGSLTIQNLENNGNHYRIGGIVGQTIIPIKNCTNNATITLDGYSTDKALSVGGIAGYIDQEGADVIGCSNTGNIVVKNSSASGEFRAAGIVGYINEPADILNCTNNGSVSVTGITSNQFISGVVGGKLKNIAVTISDCVNGEGGDITLSSPAHNSAMYMAGVIAGCAGGSTSVLSCKNYGDITNDCEGGNNSNTSSPALSTGGIVGRVTDGRISVVSCENHGNITNNCPATNDANPGIRLGGIIGYTHQVLDSNSNNANYGDVKNTASSAKHINIGGIIGYIQAGHTISNCSNQGTISNSGKAVEDISIGGIIGRSNRNVTLTKCSNGADGSATLGTITNTGTSTTTSPNTQIGGLVGFSSKDGDTYKVTMNASDGDRNVNYGPVSDVSASAYPAVGGIVGFSTGGSDLSNCLNAGAISVGGSEDTPRSTVYMGGILGQTSAAVTIKYAQNTGSVTFNTVTTNVFMAGIVGLLDKIDSNISYSENSGPVTASGQANGLWIAGVLGSTGWAVCDYIKNSAPITVKNCYIKTSTWLSGCVGRFDSGENTTSKTVTGMENTGNITMKEGITTDKQDSWQYIGGILGSGDKSNKTLKSCHNKAKLDLRPSAKMYVKCRMGGLAGIINKNPSGSSSEGDVRLYSKQASQVGGLVGYLNVSTYENLTYKGTVYTNGCEGTNYIGGIVGNVNASARTFKNCAVYGTIHGANANTGAGIFCNASSKITATFTDCKIGIGTHRKASSDGNGSYDYKFTASTEITEDLAKAAFTATKATDVVINSISIVDPSTF